MKTITQQQAKELVRDFPTREEKIKAWKTLEANGYFIEGVSKPKAPSLPAFDTGTSSAGSTPVTDDFDYRETFEGAKSFGKAILDPLLKVPATVQSAADSALEYQEKKYYAEILRGVMCLVLRALSHSISSCQNIT